MFRRPPEPTRTDPFFPYPTLFRPAAGRRVVEAGDLAQQGGLAAARGAQQREELALADLHRYRVERGELAELPRQAVDVDDDAVDPSSPPLVAAPARRAARRRTTPANDRRSEERRGGKGGVSGGRGGVSVD